MKGQATTHPSGIGMALCLRVSVFHIHSAILVPKKRMNGCYLDPFMRNIYLIWNAVKSSTQASKAAKILKPKRSVKHISVPHSSHARFPRLLSQNNNHPIQRLRHHTNITRSSGPIRLSAPYSTTALSGTTNPHNRRRVRPGRRLRAPLGLARRARHHHDTDSASGESLASALRNESRFLGPPPFLRLRRHQLVLFQFAVGHSPTGWIDAVVAKRGDNGA
jgi:hypothetical protein